MKDTPSGSNPITDAMKTVLRVPWRLSQSEDEFLAEHFRIVTKVEKREYTAADRVAAMHILRATSDGTAGTASIKELIDRTEGPVIKKPQEEKKLTQYVIAVPLPPEGTDMLDQRARWEAILESQGIKVSKEGKK
jgi:hypothetical protein